MTLQTTPLAATTQAPLGQHPLEQLSAQEIHQARRILAEAGLVAETTRFAYLGLIEPPKTAFQGDAADAPRLVRTMLWDAAESRSLDVRLSLTTGLVLDTRELNPAIDGQLPVLLEEFGIIEDILAVDPQWNAALASRGLTPGAGPRRSLVRRRLRVRERGRQTASSRPRIPPGPRRGPPPGPTRLTGWLPSWMWKTAE